ncbi:MAG: NmrA/HSCARG family protein [Longimicrobiales bacterium]
MPEPQASDSASNTKGTIAVTGVTGSQGSAAARALLDRGWSVRGLTRNPEGDVARVLAGEGVSLLKGDMDRRVDLEALFDGVRGAYVVTDFFQNGIDGELRQGKLMADVAAASGVSHYVYASVIGAERGTGIPHFDSKFEVEQHIDASGLAATILRPGVFMEDLTEKKYVPPAGWGMMGKLTGTNTPLPWIAVEDIGAIAAIVLDDAAKFTGKKIPLATDEKTLDEARAIFRAVDGKNPFKISMPTWIFRKWVSEDLVIMWEYFGNHRIEAPVETTRSLHPEALGMEAWLRKKRAGPSG